MFRLLLGSLSCFFSDSARVRLESLKGKTVNQCYTFVTEYDEESSDLPYWMQSIGRK